MVEEVNELQEAAKLLDADLVWSADLNHIRYHLAGMLRAIDACKDPSQFAQDLAHELLDDFHNDTTLG
jgi:hypothetical protein